MTAISIETAIDELVTTCPKAVRLLIEEGLPCVVCGEPFWGTLGELAKSKGWGDAATEQLVTRIRQQCDAN